VTRPFEGTLDAPLNSLGSVTAENEGAQA
jgi:hypothetical protein